MTVSANLSKPSAVVAKVEAAAAAGRLSAGSVANIKRWLTVPPYRKYVPRIVQLVDAEQFVQLDALFWEVVPFGTGGRRGTMAELGSATINERTIAESAHGLAVYLNRSSGIRKNSDSPPTFRHRILGRSLSRLQARQPGLREGATHFAPDPRVDARERG